MGLGFRLCLCLLLAFAVISSARNTVFLSGMLHMHVCLLLYFSLYVNNFIFLSDKILIEAADLLILRVYMLQSVSLVKPLLH